MHIQFIGNIRDQIFIQFNKIEVVLELFSLHLEIVDF